MKKHQLTKKSLENLKSELNNLVNYERLKVIKEIQEARANGDLSENADYDAAKNQQSFIENRIIEIQGILDNHILIEESLSSADIVKIGSKVKILEISTDKEIEYEILGSVDNNPQLGRISNECPLAKCILGKQIGEVVEVRNIFSPYKIKILEIS